MFGLGMQELVIVGIIAVLLFGKRLPEVAKTLGGSYKKFREGLNEFQGNFDITSDHSAPKRRSQSYGSFDEIDDHEEATAPKFEPPPSEPTAETLSS